MIINLNDVLFHLQTLLPLLLGILGFGISLATFILGHRERHQQQAETELEKMTRRALDAEALIVVLKQQMLDKDGFLAIALQLLGIQSANDLAELKAQFERTKRKKKQARKL